MRGHFISALVLAAGASRRMGQAKLLLPLRGRPLLQHAVDNAAAAAAVDEIVVVIAPSSPLPAAVRLPASPPSRWVVCDEAASGQASSLACGLRALDRRAAAAAILLADQPDVGAALIDQVAAAFAAADRPAARPLYRGAAAEPVPGFPVILARSLWPRLLDGSGDRGARELLRREPELLLAVPIDGAPPADIDTWEEYRRLSGAEPS